MKTIIASPHAPKAVGPYSQAVEAGGALYVSGQLPIDAASGKMDEGIEGPDAAGRSRTSAIFCAKPDTIIPTW